VGVTLREVPVERTRTARVQLAEPATPVGRLAAALLAARHGSLGDAAVLVELAGGLPGDVLL
jgi:hypothetical protein